MLDPLAPMRFPLLLSVFLVACGSQTTQYRMLDADGGSSTDDSPQKGSPSSNNSGDESMDKEPETQSLALAKGLAITEIALFQAVKVPLVKEGQWVATKNAPIVAGREGLVRVYVKPVPGADAKPVTAELLVTTGGKTKTFAETKTLTRASSDATLATTFNLSVKGEHIAEDTTFSVALTSPDEKGARGDAPSAARFPADGGTQKLGAEGGGFKLRVKLVPVQYDADGSGRLPDTSEEQLELYRRALYALYPASSVELTVREPFAFSTQIASNGSGFGSILRALVRLRAQDAPDDDVYYMGIFAPKAGFGEFCRRGCVTGLSGLLSNPNDIDNRASVGVGFSGFQSAFTAAHEIGHAHGRPHAPSGDAGDPDPLYPNPNGTIGVWGYSLNTQNLFGPRDNFDLMGYGDPQWVSDYTFGRLFKRMQAVGNARSVVRFSAPRPYRFISVDADGTLGWGESLSLSRLPTGEEHAVEFLSDTGAVLGKATGGYTPYADMNGGHLVVPEPPVGTERVRVRTLRTAQADWVRVIR